MTSRCLSQCLEKEKKRIEPDVSLSPKTHQDWQVWVSRPHWVLSTVCPWLHEIMLTSIVMSKQPQMRESKKGGKARRQDRGGNLNELIEWTKDVSSIQNSNNLGCPCLEEGKGGRNRETKRGKNKVRTRWRIGKETHKCVCEQGEAGWGQVYVCVCLVDFCWRAILRFSSDTQWTLSMSHFFSPSLLHCPLLLPFRNKMKGWSGGGFS